MGNVLAKISDHCAQFLGKISQHFQAKRKICYIIPIRQVTINQKQVDIQTVLVKIDKCMVTFLTCHQKKQRNKVLYILPNDMNVEYNENICNFTRSNIFMNNDSPGGNIYKTSFEKTIFLFLICNSKH